VPALAEEWAGIVGPISVHSLGRVSGSERAGRAGSAQPVARAPRGPPACSPCGGGVGVSEGWREEPAPTSPKGKTTRRWRRWGEVLLPSPPPMPLRHCRPRLRPAMFLRPIGSSRPPTRQRIPIRNLPHNASQNHAARFSVRFTESVRRMEPRRLRRGCQGGLTTERPDHDF
jgi:hypothetical protein